MNLTKDFSRYQKEHGFIKALLSPGWQAVLVYRLGHFAAVRNKLVKLLIYPCYYPLYYLIQILWGIGISHKATIGPGLFISHFSGIFVHGHSTIGANCNLAQGNTLGVKAKTTDPGPTLQDQVYLGAGAKVIGDIVIGSGTLIGANAVVTKNLPPQVIAVGVPAKVIKNRDGSK